MSDQPPLPTTDAPPLAELVPRAIAKLIDGGIAVGGWLAVSLVARLFGVASEGLAGVVYVAGWIAVVGYAIFFVPYMEGTTGQTIGKKLQRIKVVGVDTREPVGFGMGFARAFVNAAACGLGWVLALFDRQRQTVGDKVSRSVVVNA